MSSPLLHPARKIIAQMLWQLRALGTDPTWWRTRLMSTLTDAEQAEVTAGLHDWPVRHGNEGAEPDQTITVYDTSPRLGPRVLVTGEQIKHHGVTIRVRGRESEAEAKALAVEHDLNERAFDQRVTLTSPSQEYLVVAFSNVMLTPAFRIDFGGKELWVSNVNCMAKILAYPLTG